MLVVQTKKAESDFAPCSFAAGATEFDVAPPPFAGGGIVSDIVSALVMARTMRRLLAITAHLAPLPVVCAPPVSPDANDGLHGLLRCAVNFQFFFAQGPVFGDVSLDLP